MVWHSTIDNNIVSVEEKDNLNHLDDDFFFWFLDTF